MKSSGLTRELHLKLYPLSIGEAGGIPSIHRLQRGLPGYLIHGKLGYAMDNEEELSGVICVGAPIFNYTGYPCGAIWISGPKDRLSKEVVKNTVKAIKEVAGVISNELGFRK